MVEVYELLGFMGLTLQTIPILRDWLESRKIKILMGERIFRNVKPQYERTIEHYNAFVDKLIAFMTNEDYGCEDIRDDLMKEAEDIGKYGMKFIKEMVNAYDKDKKAFRIAVKDDTIYLIAEKWSDILSENKDASLGTLLMSALNIVNSSGIDMRIENLESVDKILTEIGTALTEGNITEDDLKEKVNCITPILPHLLEKMGFSDKEMEEAKHFEVIEKYLRRYVGDEDDV